MVKKPAPAICKPCGVPMTDNRTFATCPKCKATAPLTKAGNPLPHDRPSSELCPSCKSPMVVRYDRAYDRLVCTAEACKKEMCIKATKCIRPGCDGDLVEIRGSQGTVYRCTNFNSLTNRSISGADAVKDSNHCPVVFRDPPLLSGGPDGTNACPQCRSILLYKELKTGNEIACSSLSLLSQAGVKQDCTFKQPATGTEVCAPKIGALWDSA